jgi:hypothetical protein
VDQGAIVENKRLGYVLEIVQLVQQQRDNRRSHSAPAHTNLGLPVKKAKAAPGSKVQRKINVQGLEQAIGKVVH